MASDGFMGLGSRWLSSCIILGWGAGFGASELLSWCVQRVALDNLVVSKYCRDLTTRANPAATCSSKRPFLLVGLAEKPAFVPILFMGS